MNVEDELPLQSIRIVDALYQSNGDEVFIALHQVPTENLKYIKNMINCIIKHRKKDHGE